MTRSRRPISPPRPCPICGRQHEPLCQLTWEAAYSGAGGYFGIVLDKEARVWIDWRVRHT